MMYHLRSGKLHPSAKRKLRNAWFGSILIEGTHLVPKSTHYGSVGRTVCFFYIYLAKIIQMWVHGSCGIGSYIDFIM